MPDSSEAKAALKLKKQKYWKRFSAFASIAIFLLAVIVLYTIISEIEIDEVKAAFKQVGWPQTWQALGLTALSYLFLTGYDALAMRQVAPGQMPYRTTALGSYTSYAVSFNLGFPMLTGAAVRYRIYESHGLSMTQVVSLTLIAGFTFWLGMSWAMGGVLLLWPDATRIFTRLSTQFNFLIGAGLITANLLYLFWVWQKPRAFTVKGFRLAMPNLGVTSGQMLLGTLDICTGALVLFILLPKGYNIGFAPVLAAFVFACFLGIISHSPGGLGVFEATILLALPGLPNEAMLGSLLVYRLCYYVIPFAFALFLLGLREVTRRILAKRYSSH